ncbi:MAG TPA: ABC transporter substrate-binding protein, partial [Magnetospirillaceae bacterium]|nr:ABC transporter substrate-binding protein [Magnetospirillaceae bacterium]
PDYFGTKPRAAGIVFTIFASRDTLARSLAAGEINVALNLYPDQAAILEKEANVSVFRFSANGFTQLSANSWENPASKGHPASRDARVRQAMEFAMDKKEILAVAMGGAGTVGSTLIPESTPEWHLALPAAELRGYDPAAAKALLEKAGYVDRNRDGVLEDAAGRALDFRFLLRADNIREVKAGQMIQAYLQAVGIATRISTVDDGVLQDAIDTADYDLFIWGWGGDVDPTTILAILTTGQIGSLNEPRWSNPAYDEAVRRQATILDPKERRVVVEQAQRLAYEGAPYIILFYDGDVQAVRNDMVIGLAQVSGGPLFYANTNVNYIRAAPAAAAEAPARRRPALIAAAVAFAAAAAALAFRLRRKA